MGIQILGTGKYLPERLVTNDDMAELVDTSDEWITTRSGIKTRHFSVDITTAGMGSAAAQQALSAAGITPDQLGMILVSSITNEYTTPSVASMVAREIGAFGAVCMDINCACAGFVYGVDLASRYLDDYEYILVVSSEILSKLLDFTDRSTCVLFGDGAGAAVITKSDMPYFCIRGGDATGIPKLFARGIPLNNPYMEHPYDPLADGLPPTNGFAIYMNGPEVYKFATKTMSLAVKMACEKAGIRPEELTRIFPHQANVRILETAAKNLKLPIERFYINIDKNSNMSSACIPIALSEAVSEGSVRRGDKICIVAFGAGLTYAASVFEW